MAILSSSGTGEADDKMTLKKILASFAGLPRVLALVWSASPPLTIGLAIFTILRVSGCAKAMRI
jgi:hypothetical protein